jgi:hypothetical protein
MVAIFHHESQINRDNFRIMEFMSESRRRRGG